MEVSAYKMELGGHCVLNKKTKVKFDTTTHRRKVFFIEFTLVFGDLLRLHRLEVTSTLSLLLIIYLGMVKWKGRMKKQTVGRSRSYRLVMLKDT